MRAEGKMKTADFLSLYRVISMIGALAVNSIIQALVNITPGLVVRKLVNAIPGLKVNFSIDFSSIKMFLTANVLCSLRLFKLKTDGQTK